MWRIKNLFIELIVPVWIPSSEYDMQIADISSNWSISLRIMSYKGTVWQGSWFFFHLNAFLFRAAIVSQGWFFNMFANEYKSISLISISIKV